MNRKEALAAMRDVLVKRRDALRKALAGDLGMLKERRIAAGDTADAATESKQDEIASQLADVESQELVKIEVALENIKGGKYGICDHCEKNISMARLNALPYAKYCIQCQLAEEGQLGESDD